MLRRILEFADDALNATVIGGYDRTGFLLRQRLWSPEDLAVDLSGKVAVVSGANAGIGFETTRALVTKGARVYMLCRNAERGKLALDALDALAGGDLAGEPLLRLVDLSSRASIRDFAVDFRQNESHCDILVNNAGVLLDERQESIDGFEMTFAVNTLGCYLLTELLRPPLAAADRARVINVSSGGMYTSDLGLHDLQFETRNYDGVQAYAQSKRAEVVLAKHWAVHFSGDGTFTASMHPGWADTLSVQRSLPRFHAVTKLILRSAAEGADTIVWLACKPDIDPGLSGRFWFDRKVRAEHRLQRTRNTPDEIRDFLERLRGYARLDLPGSEVSPHPTATERGA